MEPALHPECTFKFLFATTDDVTCVLSENAIDIACVSESWLKEYIPDEVVNIEGYITHRNDSSHKHGGGIATYVRDTTPHSAWPDLIDPDYE